MSAATAGADGGHERRNHLHDLIHECSATPAEILRRLDDESGEPTAYPWPITDLEPKAADVVRLRV